MADFVKLNGYNVKDKLVREIIVNVKEYGAIGDGLTDDIEAFENALQYVYDNGGTLYIPSGTYALSRELNIGDGTNQRESNYHDIYIKGVGNGANNFLTYEHMLGKTVIKRIGQNENAMILVNGPIINVNISDLQLDCNSIAKYGLYVNHACYSTFSNISVIRHTDTAYYSTTVDGNPVVYGSAGNRYSVLQCDAGADGSQRCMKLTGSLDNANVYALDTCRNVIERFEFNYGETGSGIELEFADNNTFIEGAMYTNPSSLDNSSLILTRPEKYPNFPTNNVFINASFIKGVGGTSGNSGGNWFLPYPTSDGQPISILDYTNTLDYEGNEYMSGLKVDKSILFQSGEVDISSVSTNWTTIKSFNIDTKHFNKTFIVECALSISGDAEVKFLLNGNEMPNSYRRSGNATAYSNLQAMVTYNALHGNDTITIQAKLREASASIYGGCAYVKTVLQ